MNNKAKNSALTVTAHVPAGGWPRAQTPTITGSPLRSLWTGLITLGATTGRDERPDGVKPVNAWQSPASSVPCYGREDGS